ncbi:transcriptional regulator [Paraburkholderia terrae]
MFLVGFLMPAILVHVLVDAGCRVHTCTKRTAPIPVEKQTGIVMDGNHRLKAAALLSLRFLPCVPLDYLDPRVSVSHWDTGAPFCVNSIGRRVLQDRLPFPYKTTRHSFAPTLPHTDIPLLLLRKSTSIDARGNRSAS